MRKRSLILDAELYRYQRFCSDIAGQDIRAHGNQVPQVFAAVRSMLATALEGEANLPGAAKIRERYSRFRAELPGLCRVLDVRPSELQFVELRSVILGWIPRAPLS